MSMMIFIEKRSLSNLLVDFGILPIDQQNCILPVVILAMLILLRTQLLKGITNVAIQIDLQIESH